MSGSTFNGGTLLVFLGLYAFLAVAHLAGWLR